MKRYISTSQVLDYKDRLSSVVEDSVYNLWRDFRYDGLQLSDVKDTVKDHIQHIIDNEYYEEFAYIDSESVTKILKEVDRLVDEEYSRYNWG